MGSQDPSLIEFLKSSKYIMILVGAGISAPSGVPTFAELPSDWRGHPYSWLSTPRGFEKEPALIWAFYESMRQTVLQAQPNRAHFALARLASLKPDLLAITQKVDDLSQRAGHPASQLLPIHGSVFATACTGAPSCRHRGENFSHEPVMNLPTYNVFDTTTPFPSDLTAPRCPQCQLHLLRPGIVWYGELLAPGTLEKIDDWLDAASPEVDLMLVIGASGGLSSGFIGDARARGARVAHFNTKYHDQMVEPEDWVVLGDVAITLPRLMGEAFPQ